MKKFAPYILILLVLIFVGLFSPTATVNAELVDETTSATPAKPQKTADQNQSEFEKEIDKYECGVWEGDLYPGCFIQTFYGLFYVIPSLLLWASAYFFNVLINITLSSSLLSKDFISEAWGIVRDLSNMFFILILLYIAIKIILDLGASEAKKMIGSVVIMALLINFSMFFTKVIIDSSNILALIFYNKVSVSTKDAQGNERPYDKTGIGEKDVAGGLVDSFNPTKLVSQEYLENARTQTITVNGEEKPHTDGKVSEGILIGMLLISGVLMFFAAYCLIIVGLSFLGRLIELLVLIIFSPFAFMSSTVPKLGGVDYIGWDAWFKRLIKVSFMAPIFMFFLYFIFMIIHAKLFDGLITASKDRIIESILMIVLPALLVLVLLLKATKFAKEGSGVFGEMVMKGAKMAGGLALGAATGGAAIAGRATAGRAGAAMTNSRWAKKWEANYFGGEAVMAGLKKVGGGSFDLRGAKIGGKTLASATGMKVGEAQKGGFAERREKDIKKRIERAKEIEVGEDEPLKKALNKTEANLQGLLSANAKEIETLDKTIEKKRQEAIDAERDFKAGTITQTDLQIKTNELKNAKDNKKDFIKGNDYMTTDSAGVASINKGTGINIDVLEKLKKDQVQNIKTENVVRRQAYAKKLESGTNKAWNLLISGGQYALHRGANEAANKIRMETKLDSGTKT